jgi:hypothetical protein
MAAAILDLGCAIQCPHGGQATVTPGNTRVMVGGNPALLVTDVVTIAGCSFNVSGAPVPCVTVQWSGPATRNTVSAAAVLLETSVGVCVNAAGAPQGTAVVNGVQTGARGE